MLGSAVVNTCGLPPPESTDNIPSHAVSTVAHAALTETVDEMQAMIDDDFDNRMYQVSRFQTET